MLFAVFFHSGLFFYDRLRHFLFIFVAVFDTTVNALILLLQFLCLCSTIFIGWRRTLTFDDIWDIRDEDSSSKIMPAFERNWHRQKAKVLGKKAKKYVNAKSA